MSDFTPSPYLPTRALNPIPPTPEVVYQPPPPPVQPRLPAGSTPGPIIPQLQQATQSFINKYTALAPGLKSLPQSIVRPLMQYDLQRVQRGAFPLSANLTGQVLGAAMRQAPVTPPPRPSFAKRAVADLGSIVTAIPKIPGQLITEAKDLITSGPREITSAITHHDIRALARAPGIRFAPGAGVVGGLSPRDHPLMAFLDVLPVAGGALRRSGATAALSTQFADLAAHPAIAPTLAAAQSSLRASTVGNTLMATFSPTAKDVSQRLALENTRLARNIRSNIPTNDPLIIATREAVRLRGQFPDIPDSRVAELTRAIQTPTTPGSPLTSIPDLTPNETLFLTKAQDINSRLGESSVVENHLGKFGDELYTTSEAKELSDSQAAVHSSLSALSPHIDFLSTHLNSPDIPPIKLARLNTVSEGISSINPNDLSGVTSTRAAIRPLLKDTSLPLPLKQSLSKIYSGLKSTSDAAKSFDALHASITPARWDPLLESAVNKRMLAHYSPLATSPEHAGEIAKLIAERNYTLLPDFSPATLQGFQREVSGTWRDLKSAGFNPFFVHHVDPARAASRLSYPHINESLRAPSISKERTLDLTPTVDDVTVALSDQAISLLERRGAEAFTTDLINTWGKDSNTLLERYLPAARARAATPGATATSVRAQAQALINREWTKYDPKNFLAFSSTRLPAKTADTYLPKYIADNLSRLHGGTKLTATIDPVMNLYRTTLLALSPRWLVNNIIGGAMVTLPRTGLGVIKHLPEAWHMARAEQKTMGGEAARALTEKEARAGLLPEELGGGGMGSVPQEMMEWASKPRPLAERLSAAHDYAAGQTLRRIYDTSRKSLTNVVNKSYEFNSLVDDMYRSASYLYGTDKALSKGMSVAAAQETGVALARKVFANWDRMTPIERSVLRCVFPFYGWYSHIAKYALTFPIDHPVRTAIIGSFARAEQEDENSGIAERFRNTFFLGSPDKDGIVRSVNIGGMNPFSDVASYFTMMGWTRSTNPIISGVLQSLGINPTQGSPELYPDMTYDPESGRLTPTTPGLASSLLTSVVPQADPVLGALGFSSKFKDLLDRGDPQSVDAAHRLLRGQLGLPVLTRDINVTQEAIKAELARGQAYTRTRNDAMKSGKWDEAIKQYPNLKTEALLLAQVQALNPQLFAPLTPPANAPPESLQTAFRRAVGRL